MIFKLPSTEAGQMLRIDWWVLSVNLQDCDMRSEPLRLLYFFLNVSIIHYVCKLV